MNQIFQTMLFHCDIKTKDDRTNALCEVIQQIAPLAGLYRGGT